MERNVPLLLNNVEFQNPDKFGWNKLSDSIEMI